MPSETTDHRRPTTLKNHNAAPHEPEHLPCPRCDSTNTKFCYYNNYNFSQPRHFCKSCRRYWTQGGTLRDIPVGGGSRKNAKRLRVATDRSVLPSSTSDVATSPLLSSGGHSGGGGGMPCGSFTSLLSSAHGPGLFGPGHEVFGFEHDVGFGYGRMFWPFGGGGVGGQSGGGGWQLENGGGGGDCFVLPELAISTPGSATK